ncbi:MAG: crotonobetainyl-CoA--carnitine CoA-transferase, partial [Deltaproteobacteria bacterium]|nr:crotonobetainyl-CoA--carnitine CoA-transferase [Deltaproteobacteria bacterium]
FGTVTHSSVSEKGLQQELLELLKNTPINDDELLANLGLYLTTKSLARIIFFYELYKKLVYLHGVVMEFGTRWGQTISLLSILRGMFEPYNRTRRMLAFDTFEGLKGMTANDTGANKCADGSYATPDGYERYLDRLLALQEQLNPLGHLQKYEVIKGDVLQTLPDYLKKHPETMISMVVFDMDIYAPTVKTLEMIKPYLFKGSLLVFDELCDEVFPGETIAVREVLDMKNFRFERLPLTSRLSYLVYE